MKIISKFTREYRWLSNFHDSPVEYEGLLYPTVEHAYQASKTDILDLRETIRSLPTPTDAKKAGKLLPLREDWTDQKKLSVMEELCFSKFTTHKHLKILLLSTKDTLLLEGNTWHDNFWGSCQCTKCGDLGENHLGKILMKIREDIKP